MGALIDTICNLRWGFSANPQNGQGESPGGLRGYADNSLPQRGQRRCDLAVMVNSQFILSIRDVFWRFATREKAIGDENLAVAKYDIEHSFDPIGGRYFYYSHRTYRAVLVTEDCRTHCELTRRNRLVRRQA